MSIWSKVKAAVDLEALLVEACGPGQRKGRATMFSAPWRSDSSPSLAYYADGEAGWHDFGEGIGGDVIDLVCRWRNIKKGAALKWLKQRAGITVEDPTPEQVERYERRDAVRDALTIAAHWFFERWEDSDETRELRQELLHEHYGWTPEIVEALRIGFVPLYDPSQPGLWDHLTACGVTADTISELHLFITHAGRHRAEGRLAFPYWSGGKVSYFAFRETKLSNSGAGAKYIKLQEGELVRNPAFWGWDPRPKNERPRRAWTPVAEGVADAISVAMLGLPVISPVTTKFAADDLIKVKRAAVDLGRLVLVPDQEASGAGMRGAISTCVALAAEGVEARIAVLPHEAVEGTKWKTDANEFIRDLMRSGLSVEGARARVDELCENAPPLLDLFVERLPRADAAGFDKELGPVLDLAAGLTDFERDAVLARIVGRTGAGKRALNAAVKTALTKRKKTEANEAGVKPFERGDHVEVSERLLAEDLAGTQYGDGKIHRYAEATGVWEALKPEAIHEIVKRYAGAPIITSKGYAALRMNHGDLTGIRHTTEEALEHRTADFFRDAPIGFSFTNGFVRIEPDGVIKLEPHARENRARWGYDFDFDPTLKAPNFAAFLREITRDDPTRDRLPKVRLVLEHAGASLIGQAWRGGIALILHGHGNDGKSTLVSCLKGCFPRETVTAVPPHDFGDDYTRAMLAGSLYNVVGELADKELRDAEAVKDVITGRDLLKARHPYERPFFFTARGGHVIVANGLPPVSDQTRGFWRRWAVLPFTRAFRPEEEDRDIEARLESERQAIVVMLIEAAAKWVGRGFRFELPEAVKLATAAWRDGADAVSTWLASECELTAGDGTSGSDAFSAFDRWREQNRFASMSSRTFGERLKAMVRSLAREGRLPQMPPHRYSTYETNGCRLDGAVWYPLSIKVGNISPIEDIGMV